MSEHTHGHHHDELSDEQLNQLQHFLVDHLEQDGCMPLDVSHGFLTALYSGPRQIGPSEWLPMVLGQIEFDNDEEAENITSLLVKLSQNVEQDLDHGHYAPVILYKPMDDQEPLPMPYGWCQGYLIGLGVQGEAIREQALKDEQASNFMAPIMVFMMYEEDQMYNPPDEVAHRQTALELAAAAMSLYHWWREDNHAEESQVEENQEHGFEVH